MRHNTTIGKHTIGIVYMAFGQNSANAVVNNLNSLHRLGIDIPATVIGNTEVPDTNFIKWMGKNPFRKNPSDPDHTFFAGYIKPEIYNLSPYDYTLYLDADTEFRKDPMNGFRLLDKNDFVIYQSRPDQLTIEIIVEKPEMYNGFSIECAKDTIEEAKEAREPSPGVICSGIIFFRKSPAVAQLFKDWAIEWKKYFAWDEQGPLIRAMRKHEGIDIVISRLNAWWNCNSDHKDQIIHHDWGVGIARDDREVKVTYKPPPSKSAYKFCNDVPEIVIKQIETIPGYIGLEDEKELYRQAKLVPKNGYIVELGSLFGRSACALALGNPEAIIYSVDIYDQIKLGTMKGTIDWSQEGNFNRLKIFKINNVKFLKGNSKTIVLPNRSIDLLWIDASHEYEDVKHDIFRFGPRAKVIMCHDYHDASTDADSHPGVTKAVDEFLLAYPEFHIENHIWSTVTICKE
jgi:hypothetical protein